MAHEQEYSVWTSMKSRCANENDKDYARYGGRGISVCQRWQDSFEDFMKDMGPRPEGGTIERKNNDGNYEPKNCEWADRAAQSKNRNFAKTHEFDVEIFSTGTWNGDKYTEQDLEDMVKNFEALKEQIKPPVKLGHNDKQMKDGGPALGWITALKKSGNKLIARLSEVPDIVFKAIKSGRYKRVSSEIFWNLKHGGKTFERVLAAVALLGADIPAVTNLADLEAYLSQSTDKGSFETVKLYSFETDEDGKLITKKTKGTKKMSENQEMKDLLKRVTALETTIETKDQDIKTLKALADENQAEAKAAEKAAKEYKAKLETAEKEAAEKLETDRLSEMKKWAETMVKEFKMLPAGRDLLFDEEKRSYTKEQGFSVPFETFKVYVEMQAKVLDPKEISQTDREKDKVYTDVNSKIDAMTRTYAAENKLEYGEALVVIMREHPELAEDYINDGVVDKDSD